MTVKELVEELNRQIEKGHENNKVTYPGDVDPWTELSDVYFQEGYIRLE